MRLGKHSQKTTKPRAQKQKRGTTMTFIVDELSELAKYVGAGMVLLQTKPSVTTRIKSALSRLGLQPPAGL